MEPTEQSTIVVINGNEYDAANASEATYGLIQDLSTIQAEMNRIKVSYDITSLARQAILQKAEDAIADGTSGLVQIIKEEDVTVDEITEKSA